MSRDCDNGQSSGNNSISRTGYVMGGLTGNYNARILYLLPRLFPACFLKHILQQGAHEFSVKSLQVSKSALSNRTLHAQNSGNRNYGGRGLGRVNWSRNCGVTPSVTSCQIILTGLSFCSFAVRITVAMIDTFLLPWSDCEPKVIFRKITRFLKLCSAKLFVGNALSGYIRKVKISYLCLIILSRKVSVSVCKTGSRLYNFLNRDFIFLLRVLHSSRGISSEYSL